MRSPGRLRDHDGQKMHRLAADGLHGDASVQNTLWLQNLAQLEETGVMDRQTWDMLSRLYELFITASEQR